MNSIILIGEVTGDPVIFCKNGGNPYSCEFFVTTKRLKRGEIERQKHWVKLNRQLDNIYKLKDGLRLMVQGTLTYKLQDGDEASLRGARIFADRIEFIQDNE